MSILESDILKMEIDELRKELNLMYADIELDDGMLKIVEPKNQHYESGLRQHDVDRLHEYGVTEFKVSNGMWQFSSQDEYPKDYYFDFLHEFTRRDFHGMKVHIDSDYFGKSSEAPVNLNLEANRIDIGDLWMLYKMDNCNIFCDKLAFDHYTSIGALRKFLQRNTLRANRIRIENCDGLYYDVLGEPKYPEWIGHHGKEVIRSLGCNEIYIDFRCPYNDACIWTRDYDLLNDSRKDVYKHTNINGEEWFFGRVKEYKMNF